MRLETHVILFEVTVLDSDIQRAGQYDRGEEELQSDEERAQPNPRLREAVVALQRDIRGDNGDHSRRVDGNDNADNNGQQ